MSTQHDYKPELEQQKRNQVLAAWVLYLVVATVTAVAVVGWLLGY
jgi:uncharacterized membrane protein